MTEAKHITYRAMEMKSHRPPVYAVIWHPQTPTQLARATYHEIKHIVRHSPSGLSWGYGGSGSADCALSILHDFCERTGRPIEVAERWYQEFKRDWVAPQGDGLIITGADIADWLEDKEAPHEHAV